jgi:hypothetical protein
MFLTVIRPFWWPSGIADCLGKFSLPKESERIGKSSENIRKGAEKIWKKFSTPREMLEKFEKT